LASKRNLSNGTDVRDLAETLTAFQRHNGVRITLRAHLIVWNNSPDMEWVAEAWAPGAPVSGAVPWAYAKVRCTEKHLVRLEDVVLQLLYALDFQLAELEFKRGERKS